MTDSRLKAVRKRLERMSDREITERLNRVYAVHDLTYEEKAFAQAAARAGFKRVPW